MDLARYAELFRTESREHLAEIDASLMALEHDGDIRHVTVLFRSTHTIKGMAASMGYERVEQLSHALETLLDVLRSGTRALDGTTIALLFDGTDALGQAVDAAVHARGEADAPAAALLERLRTAADASSTNGASGASPLAVPLLRARGAGASLPQELGALGLNDALPTGTPAGAKIVEVRIAHDAALKGVRAVMVLARLGALGAVQSVRPEQPSWGDDTFDGAITFVLATETADDALVRAVRSAGDIESVTVRIPTQRRTERETLRHVRIDLRRLDTLLDLVGELVITRDRLVRTADALGDTAAHRLLLEAVQDTARLVGELQEEVLQTRMLPVGQVFDRFPRLVRDVARDLGKDITFVTEGRDIELDRSLLDAIGDPIVHLLRNSIDHGVELPDARRRAGKVAAGRLVLRAARDKAGVIVQVADDGGGIDRSAVLRRAQADGVVGSDVATLSDDALLRILARAGFSTAPAVTAISGRGVGIDVVASRVRAMGGTLELCTVEGQGTTFTLRLPVTVAIVRALLMQVAGETYVLPAAHAVEAFEYDMANVICIDNRETVTLRDEVMPLLRLRRRFGLPPGPDDASHLVVVETAGRRVALQVDTLVGHQDVVVKPYDVPTGAETLFMGATILGDGTPSLIVDLGGLV